MPVTFHFHKAASLRNRRRLKAFIDKLIRKEGFILSSLSIVFCSDDYLLKINQDFLAHDYFTDIITFNLSEEPHLIEGELFISIDRVRDNARTYAVTTENELLRVIFHGILHLCGYKDKSKSDQLKIRSKEDYYLILYKRST